MLLILFSLTNCHPSAASSQPTAISSQPTVVSIQPTALSTQSSALSTPQPLAPSPQPPTTIPTRTATPTPSATPTATPIGPCDLRDPGDDLLTLITKTYGVSREYEPDDLISLNDHFGPDVTLGYPIEVRAIMLEPLTQLINDMQAAGLKPQILSGYRSYAAQSIAFDKWVTEFPDHATIISAPPGHSEHQLGTTIDFGSPTLDDYIDDPELQNLQFHTYFYKTPEGAWLLENAHTYGFTLSYPRETFELTGFYYEPWHYRYVGTEMAAQLKQTGVSLAQFQLNNQPEPCIP